MLLRNRRHRTHDQCTREPQVTHAQRQNDIETRRLARLHAICNPWTIPPTVHQFLCLLFCCTFELKKKEAKLHNKPYESIILVVYTTLSTCIPAPTTTNHRMNATRTLTRSPGKVAPNNKYTSARKQPYARSICRYTKHGPHALSITRPHTSSKLK